MRVRIDAALCTGQGRCYALRPQLFEADEEGYNRARGTELSVPEDREEIARRAVRACPEGAIRVSG